LKKVRVHELAKDYGMQGKDLAKLLRDLGFEQVKSNMSVLDDGDLMMVEARLSAHGLKKQPAGAEAAAGALPKKKLLSAAATDDAEDALPAAAETPAKKELIKKALPKAPIKKTFGKKELPVDEPAEEPQAEPIVEAPAPVAAAVAAPAAAAAPAPAAPQAAPVAPPTPPVVVEAPAPIAAAPAPAPAAPVAPPPAPAPTPIAAPKPVAAPVAAQAATPAAASVAKPVATPVATPVAAPAATPAATPAPAPAEAPKVETPAAVPAASAPAKADAPAAAPTPAAPAAAPAAPETPDDPTRPKKPWERMRNPPASMADVADPKSYGDVPWPPTIDDAKKTALRGLAEEAAGDGIRSTRAKNELQKTGWSAIFALVEQLQKLDYKQAEPAMVGFDLNKLLETITGGVNVRFEPVDANETMAPAKAEWNTRTVKVWIDWANKNLDEEAYNTARAERLKKASGDK
jgi:hypothetical protein